MKYHTVLINGYSSQAGTDKRATGGVQLVQVAQSAVGWRIRQVDSNGRHESPGSSEVAGAQQVRELIKRALERAENDELNGRARTGFADREGARLCSELGIGLAGV